MRDIQPGDVVERFKGSSSIMRIGTVVRVDGLCIHGPTDAEPGTVGLIFNGWRFGTPDYCECWFPDNFRKIRPADEQFTRHIRALEPIREDA